MRDALIAVDPAGAGAPARTGAAVSAPAAASRAAGATSARAPAPPARKSKALFWAFAGVVVVAAAGGGAVTFLAREKVAGRRGHPDTISPAQAQAAPPAVVPAATATPTATATPNPTSTSNPTPTPTSIANPTPRKVAAAAKRDPAKALALYRKGEARRAEQDIDGAIKLYLAAESSDPRLADVQKKLALCYQLKGDTRRAADRYRRYLATRPADAERVRAILSTLE
jgi:hypothetical protein